MATLESAAAAFMRAINEGVVARSEDVRAKTMKAPKNEREREELRHFLRGAVMGGIRYAAVPPHVSWRLDGFDACVSLAAVEQSLFDGNPAPAKFEWCERHANRLREVLLRPAPPDEPAGAKPKEGAEG